MKRAQTCHWIYSIAVTLRPVVTTLSLHCDEQDGWTPLMMAAASGHHECVSILVASGADVNAISKVRVELACIRQLK